MTDYILVTTTTSTHNDADSIAAALLDNHLAACVQIAGPITSRYWWNNAVQHQQEFLCLIKTRADLYHDVEDTIRANHPYDVPEIVAIPFSHGSSDYLSWLTASTRS